MLTEKDNIYGPRLDVDICIYLEPEWPLFLKVNSPKQDLFQSKQGSFGFQVPIHLGSLE